MYFQGCGRIKTPFQHASTVCGKYKDRVRRLSGLGMQISAALGKQKISDNALVNLRHCNPRLNRYNYRWGAAGFNSRSSAILRHFKQRIR